MTDRETADMGSISEQLKSIGEAEYGQNYQSHVLTMYQDFVASAETVSDRRNKSNAFFLSICTGFLGVYAHFIEKDIVNANGGETYILLSALGGIVFSLIWLGLISSHKALNSAKFKVIQEIERQLPLAPFKAEEWAYKRPGKTMVALNKYESYMPWVFIAMYGVIFIVVSMENTGFQSSIPVRVVLSLAAIVPAALLSKKIGKVVADYFKK